ncbi:MAG: UDP-N-acetylglucosamine 1-carboxyvinyltransferase, partial [bacterium]
LELVKKLRASSLLLGPLLARYGRAEIAMPGGCNIGPRPLDQHIKGLRALGAEIKIEQGFIRARAKKLQGASIYLDVTSVGATENIMMAACLAEGKTVIENAAKEPEIVDVANLLNAMGANVKGAGTDVIRIRGVKGLQGVHHTIIPDRIEAGTFMIAAAASRGEVVIEDVIPEHLEPVIAKLREAGALVEVGEDSIKVTGREEPYQPLDIKTLPYPGFPTDLQSPITALLTTAAGTSIIKENIFENRFRHVDEFKRMGAKIKVEGRTAVVEGVDFMSGARVRATDLRAGAALLIAALMARGETVIQGTEHIDRGYENITGKFRALGARIRRED